MWKYKKSTPFKITKKLSFILVHPNLTKLPYNQQNCLNAQSMFYLHCAVHTFIMRRFASMQNSALYKTLSDEGFWLAIAFIGFNNQMRLHLSSFVWNAAQTTSWSGLSDRILSVSNAFRRAFTPVFSGSHSYLIRTNAWSDQV